MPWENLPTNYTDAVWEGLKRYNQINNADGTVSFQDVTLYTGKENSFFGALDANQMNGAINDLMNSVPMALGIGEEIPSGADLNDYVTPGTYTFLGSDASSISNYPPGIAKLTFRLTVMKTGNTTLLQMFVCTDVVCIRYNNRYDNTDHYGSWRQIAAEDDTGWQSAALTSDFKLYASGSPVRYRRKNGVVTVTGIVSPASNTNDLGSSTRVDMFTLPEGYRPVSDVVIMCQGTSTDLWVFGITTSGAAFASRYRDETGYVTPDTTAWMPFTATFLTA